MSHAAPSRPSVRLELEMKLIGGYELLILKGKDLRRLFEDNALIRRQVCIGVSNEEKKRLASVLDLKIEE
ncbi:hypothetical protein BGZ51_004737 [Haplosporangium sp. Z 767]|nr:hypothetical protein BGZ51_004737 [Haplosporangium sp. Z 767]KAF9186092.1 hypothetical protein BGZ50_002645 [Haplosporangium sp. Z 11]